MLTAAAVVDAHQERWLISQLRGPVAGRIALAADPELTAGIAARLAKDRSVKVRHELAVNRRCPQQVLEELAGLRNVAGVAARHTLEQLSGRTRAADASVPGSDAGRAQLVALAASELADGYGLSREVLHDPDLPAELRVRIIYSGRGYDRERLLENPSLTWPEARRIFQTLAERASTPGHPSPMHMAAYYYASNPCADPGWLAETVAEIVTLQSADGGLGAKLARNPNTPADALRALLDAGLHRDQVLTNPATTTELVDVYAARELPRLGGRDDSWARRALQRAAKHPKAARALLVHLPLRGTSDLALFRLLRTHCISGAHAAAALQLSDTFPGSVGELLDLAELVATDAG